MKVLLQKKYSRLAPIQWLPLIKADRKFKT
jgi:hypothetical protein